MIYWNFSFIVEIYHWGKRKLKYFTIYLWYSPLKNSITEFRWGVLTGWVIRSWVQLALRANFVQLLQFHLLFSVRFYFGYCLRRSPHLFKRSIAEVITWVQWNLVDSYVLYVMINYILYIMLIIYNNYILLFLELYIVYIIHICIYFIYNFATILSRFINVLNKFSLLH